MTDMPVRLTSRRWSRYVCAFLLALVVAACGDGVDGDRRQLAVELGESIETPDGYERSTEIIVRDPDLSAFSPQPGAIVHRWTPIDPESASPVATFRAFHPVLETAGYQLVIATECTDEILSLVYWHPDTGTANFGHSNPDQGTVVSFNDSWTNNPPTAALLH